MKINKKELKLAVVGSLVALSEVENMFAEGISVTVFLSTIKTHYHDPILLLDFLIKQDYVVINNNLIQLTEQGRESGLSFIKEFNKNETNQF